MNHLEKVLDKNKVKPTAMRLLVLQYISYSKKAVSLSDIEAHFYKSERTTLFRTLKTFVKSKIAHKIDDGTGVTKYAICAENCQCSIDEDLHVHFHCHSCSETTCMPNNKIPSIELPPNFQAQEINLVVKGVCDKCAN